jgi:hypothetical protein
MFLGNAPIPSSAITNSYRYHNYQLVITAPDGTKTSQTFPTVSDTTDNQIYTFAPTQIGIYNITFNYLGQTLGVNDQPSTSANINDTYLPSSYSTILTVQQNAVPAGPVPVSLFPTAYWTRPIYGENSFWYPIASNWLGTGSPVSSLAGSGTISGFGTNSFAERTPGDAVGSLTGHIMWTKPIEVGGIVGDNQSYITGNSYFEGSAYSQRFTNPIIVAGILIYNPPVSFTGTSSGPTTALDLSTGNILWQSTYLPNSDPTTSGPPNNVPVISFAYVYDLQDPNQHGTYPPILFSSNFAMAFNAYTGNWLFNVTGVPSGTVAQGPQGEQLRYVMTNLGTTTIPNWNLAEWNSTLMWTGTGFQPGQAGNSPGIDTSSAAPYFTPTYSLVNTTTWQNNVKTISSVNYTANTAAVNASVFNSADIHNRFDWNVSMPWRNTMSSTPTVMYAMYDNMMILRNGSLPALGGSQAPYTYFAIDLNTAHSTLGQILWMKTYDAPAGNITVSQGPIDPSVGVFVEGYKETTQWVGYSMATGDKLWTTNGQDPLDYFGNPIYPYVTGMCAYGYLYSCGQAGIIYAYDMKTGTLDWTYGNGGTGNSTESYLQRPGNFPIEINAIGNGVLYVVTTEHTVETPIFKGAMAWGINATNGDELWSVSDYTGEFSAMSYAIADGKSVFYNGYDDSIYTLGQGPSSLTVSAPNLGAASSQPVVISGTVTDVSAGTTQSQQASDFPNGVPVASDASMTAWMGYVYQQQPMPTNFTGVNVQINVVDANGNYRTIGTAITDATGKYNLVWTPDISGTYQVIATFAGTAAYWPSSATTAFTVMAASATVTPAPTPAPSAADQYFLPGVAAIIVVIIIVGALTMLLLRKRP